MKVSITMVNRLVDDLAEIVGRLDAMLNAKNEVLDNANAAEFPRQARLDKLEAQVEILQAAFDDIELVVSNLSDYE
jgi:hypothetical protein